MDNNRKQQIINEVTNRLRSKQWFNGCGYTGDTLTIAFNYYPAFEIKEVKETMLSVGVPEYELKNINEIMPGTRKDDIPSHIRY